MSIEWFEVFFHLEVLKSKVMFLGTGIRDGGRRVLIDGTCVLYFSASWHKFYLN